MGGKSDAAATAMAQHIAVSPRGTLLPTLMMCFMMPSQLSIFTIFIVIPFAFGPVQKLLDLNKG